jgi:hypothetical protein
LSFNDFQSARALLGSPILLLLRLGTYLVDANPAALNAKVHDDGGRI